jgi:hypothetical protein
VQPGPSLSRLCGPPPAGDSDHERLAAAMLAALAVAAAKVAAAAAAGKDRGLGSGVAGGVAGGVAAYGETLVRVGLAGLERSCVLVRGRCKAFSLARTYAHTHTCYLALTRSLPCFPLVVP